VSTWITSPVYRSTYLKEYTTKYYNPNAIIAVGFRVNSEFTQRLFTPIMGKRKMADKLPRQLTITDKTVIYLLEAKTMAIIAMFYGIIVSMYYMDK
jgi:hypothetical protein